MKSQRVLVIDDEADIREGVSRWLNAAGFETLDATDGVEGCEAAASEIPDVILLDMKMPRRDGLETLRQLRLDPRTRNIPVTMLSASLRDEERALEAGAAYFVKKPYQGRQLLTTVRATLETQPN